MLVVWCYKNRKATDKSGQIENNLQKRTVVTLGLALSVPV